MNGIVLHYWNYIMLMGLYCTNGIILNEIPYQNYVTYQNFIMLMQLH